MTKYAHLWIDIIGLKSGWSLDELWLNSGWDCASKRQLSSTTFFSHIYSKKKRYWGNKLDMISSADCYIKGAINSETKTKNAKSGWTLVELWLIFGWSSVDLQLYQMILRINALDYINDLSNTPSQKKIPLFKKWLNGLIHKFVLLLTNVEPETMSSITLGEIGKDSGVLLRVRSIKRMGHHSAVTNVKKNSRISSGIIM